MKNTYLIMFAKGFVSFSIIMFAAILLSNCSEDIYTEPTINDEMVVVSAFLFENEKIEYIRLTKTHPLGSEDSIAIPINDADVYLIKNNAEFKLEISDIINGFYSYKGEDLEVEVGDLFNLKIVYEDQIITAVTEVPTKPSDVSIAKETIEISTTFTGGKGGFVVDTNTIKISWSNPDSTLYYVVLQNLETTPSLITYSSNFKGNQKVTFPPSSTSEFLIGRRNLTYWGRHAAIVYKVNQEYADLYESRTQDSRNLNEPISNISNGLGVFSAFASDTVYFNVISE